MSNNIRALRIAFLLSPRSFARQIGIYPDYVARLESGNRPLSDVWISAVAKGLGVPPEVVTEPGLDVRMVISTVGGVEPRTPVLCPVAARYAILALVAKLGDLHASTQLDEDQIADAVQHLVAYVDNETPGLPGEANANVHANRLLKGLQITALAILQTHETDLGADFQDRLEIASQGAVKLLEHFSRIDEVSSERGTQ